MDREALLVTAPATYFREVLDETAQALRDVAYVEEWLGPRQRLPVFDVGHLREFAAPVDARDRLATLLASFVKTRSGSVWERRGGRWHRRRYSDLSLIDLADMGAYARLGDLALFLAGVFPEHVLAHPPEPLELSRLARSLGGPPGEIVRTRHGFWLYEWIGAAAYRRVGEARLERDFQLARRLLNLVTARHLFPLRERWFRQSAS